MKNQRQQEIAALLAKKGTLKIKFLVDHFGVSIDTIRRDIEALEQRKMLKKIYGGVQALIGDSLVPELEEWNKRSKQCRDEKQRIAARAMEYISPGSTIALDIGTTTHMLVKRLANTKGLTILTNSLRSAGELCRNNKNRVYMIGGQLQGDEQITMGAYAQSFIENFVSIDFFICGTDGITIEAGTTEYLETAVELKRRLGSLAKRTILIADHSKFGRNSMFKSLPLSNIDLVVTDDKIDERYIRGLREAGVEVVVA